MRKKKESFDLDSVLETLFTDNGKNIATALAVEFGGEKRKKFKEIAKNFKNDLIKYPINTSYMNDKIFDWNYDAWSNYGYTWSGSEEEDNPYFRAMIEYEKSGMFKEASEMSQSSSEQSYISNKEKSIRRKRTESYKKLADMLTSYNTIMEFDSEDLKAQQVFTGFRNKIRKALKKVVTHDVDSFFTGKNNYQCFENIRNLFSSHVDYSFEDGKWIKKDHFKEWDVKDNQKIKEKMIKSAEKFDINFEKLGEYKNIARYIDGGYIFNGNFKIEKDENLPIEIRTSKKGKVEYIEIYVDPDHHKKSDD